MGKSLIRRQGSASRRSARRRRILLADIAFPEKGVYTLQLAEKHGDELLPIGPIKQVSVDITWWELLADWLQDRWKEILAFATLVHTLIFLGLIAGARRSETCFRLLFDPVFAKFGLWFYAALRWLRPLQGWLLARWFAEVRRAHLRAEAQPYLPVPLARSGTDGPQASEAFLSEALAERWREMPKVWLRGPSGMGKTALVRALERRCFLAEPTLGAALRRFGRVPVVIAARDARELPVDKADPGGWVVWAAGRVLARGRFEVRDLSLLRAFLRSGLLGVVLDGLNEVERDEEVQRFAETMPDMAILATSQRSPPEQGDKGPTWAVLELPRDIGAFVDQLLALYLGAAGGRDVAAAISASGLWAAMHSGYDVRLVVDLLLQRGTPLDRCRAAGWNSTRYARRARAKRRPSAPRGQARGTRLGDGAEGRAPAHHAQLDLDLVGPLAGPRQRVLRVVGDGVYEFRHDQMRAYLAARHLAEAPPSTVVLAQWIQGSPIWTRHRNEQAELFDFLAAMQGDGSELQTLWRFAAADPGRAVMQQKLQEVAARRGWPLVLEAA